jgi:E3 ubiquitin-protein ligase HUWE1
MDVRHYSEDEDMDQEDEDQDVEMEYGDETGSEDTSSSGSDHEEDDLDHRTPDSWNDEGDEEEEDLVEQRDEEGDEEEEVGDDNDEGEDDEEDEDIMWEVRWNPSSTSLMMLNCRLQDIQEEEAALGMALEDVENEAGHGGNCCFARSGRFTDLLMVVPIHINHEDDEPDMGSDEEEFVLEHGNFHDGIFSFGDVFVNPGSRDGGGLFVHRRHRGNGMFSTANK